MKKVHLVAYVLVTLLLGACGEGNDTPDPDPEPTNKAPVIENQTFTVSENVDDVTIIGTMESSDPDGDLLSFSILENSGSLFEITTDGGEITLVSGRSLDFETATSHQLVVAVSDGSEQVNATVTITVTDEDENEPPEIAENQSFSASEYISEFKEIGTVVASDADDDVLSYSIIEDTDNLFEITEDQGVISLQEGKQLDFAIASSHSIIVQVSDGKATSTGTISIMVIDVDDNAFITRWESGMIELPLYLSTVATATNYNFTVDWGDGTTGEVTSFNDPDASHTYNESGDYLVIISGTLVGFNFSMNNTSKTDIKDVIQWGEVKVGNDGGVFADCLYLEKFSANDSPDLADVTNMNNFFRNASSFNGEIGNWDVSNVTDMSSMFNEARVFNQGIGNWDVSNVTDMNEMFRRAVAFNQNIGNWDVGKVVNMSKMFLYLDDDDPPAFNQDIGNWDVSSVTAMNQMFTGASDFNQDIGGWDVSNVTDMNEMFTRAIAFNQNIGNWDVSKVINMRFMFSNATVFNQDISNWDVSNVTDMVGVFQYAYAFNQDISSWDVGSVESMDRMFYDTIAFDQDISGWNTSNVTSCSSFVSINTPINETNKVPTLGPCFGT